MKETTMADVTEFDPAFPLKHVGPRLYTLARTDIYQMNPGKLAAQSSHATSKFIFNALDSGDADLLEEMHAWRKQGGGGFGTEITLAATKAEILTVMETLKDKAFCGTVVDPTYPFTNYFGDFFTAEELTCAYVFAPSTVPADVLAVLKPFPLHP
jgi:peptidyl-tRNA hydrolase